MNSFPPVNDSELKNLLKSHIPAKVNKKNNHKFYQT